MDRNLWVAWPHLNFYCNYCVAQECIRRIKVCSAFSSGHNNLMSLHSYPEHAHGVLKVNKSHFDAPQK